MAADLPPSSRCTRFSVGAAAAMIRLPVTALPVKLILSTSGLSTSAAPSSGLSPVTTLNTPGGRSHSSHRFGDEEIEQRHDTATA